jgi:hypothetical protein
MLEPVMNKYITLLFIAIILLEGCFVLKDNSNTFVEDFTNPETDHGQRSYIELRNGDTVFGDTREPLFSGKTIVNGVSYRNKKIRHKYDLHFFFYRVKAGYARRIIRGKINVYAIYGQNGNQTNNTIYLQKGDDTEPFRARTFEDYRKLLKDCPLAVKTIDDELARKKKHLNQFTHFISTAILIYNKDCKPI